MDEPITEALRRSRDRANQDWQMQDLNDRAVPPGAAVIVVLIFSAGLTLGAIVASFAWRML